jgi:hypothetical protein
LEHEENNKHQLSNDVDPQVNKAFNDHIDNERVLWPQCDLLAVQRKSEERANVVENDGPRISLLIHVVVNSCAERTNHGKVDVILAIF